MQHTNHFFTHSLTIDLPEATYAALQEKIKTTGKTETELILQGLQWVLDEEYLAKTSEIQAEKDRFTVLANELEQKLKQYVESIVKERISELPMQSPERNLKSNLITSEPTYERVLPIPTIRALQVGDRVLVLDSDSPYYMAKLLVIKTSLIRATVETDAGEKTFLKRDLRFVEAAVES